MHQPELFDLTMCTVAVVTEPLPSPLVLTEEEIRGILRPPLVVGSLPNGDTIITSERQQLQIILSMNKMNVRDMSGSFEKAAEQIPPVVHWVYDLYKTDMTAYGINFIATVSRVDPRVWIRDHLLKDSISDVTGYEVRGGNAGLIMRAEPKTWNVVFSVDRQDEMKIDSNATQDSPSLPDTETLAGEIRQQRDRFQELLLRVSLCRQPSSAPVPIATDPGSYCMDKEDVRQTAVR